jgi:hypothetical protein
MKIGALALLAVLAVSGCSSLGSSLNHIVDPAPSASPTKSCYQQYRKWDPYRKRINRMMTRMARTAVAEAQAGDIPGLLRTLHKGGRALAKIPAVPYCADPHGFLARIIAKINAAVDDARSSSREGLGGALAPLHRLPPLIKKFNQEIRRRVRKPTHTPGVILTAVTRQQR